MNYETVLWIIWFVVLFVFIIINYLADGDEKKNKKII
jgi:hypothetical protein